VQQRRRLDRVTRRERIHRIDAVLRTEVEEARRERQDGVEHGADVVVVAEATTGVGVNHLIAQRDLQLGAHVVIEVQATRALVVERVLDDARIAVEQTRRVKLRFVVPARGANHCF